MDIEKLYSIPISDEDLERQLREFEEEEKKEQARRNRRSPCQHSQCTSPGPTMEILTIVADAVSREIVKDWITFRQGQEMAKGTVNWGWLRQNYPTWVQRVQQREHITDLTSQGISAAEVTNVAIIEMVGIQANENQKPLGTQSTLTLVRQLSAYDTINRPPREARNFIDIIMTVFTHEPLTTRLQQPFPVSIRNKLEDLIIKAEKEKQIHEEAQRKQKEEAEMKKKLEEDEAIRIETVKKAEEQRILELKRISDERKSSAKDAVRNALAGSLQKFLKVEDRADPAWDVGFILALAQEAKNSPRHENHLMRDRAQMVSTLLQQRLDDLAQ
jgi:hypothetical protein